MVQLHIVYATLSFAAGVAPFHLTGGKMNRENANNETRDDVPVSKFESNSENRDPTSINTRILEKINAGDQAAIGQVWDILGEDLRRRARNRLRQYGIAGKAESMDICNSVLIRLISKQNVDINQPAQVLGYLCRAIDNQVIDVVRQLSRQCRDHRREESQPIEDFQVQNQEHSAATIMADAEVLQEFQRTLGEDGQTFLALYLARNNWKTIGEALNMSPDAARMKWQRAIEQMRKKLG